MNMRRSFRTRILPALAAGFLLLCPPAYAGQPPVERGTATEQREALKQKLRERAESMTPEERAEKRAALRERWGRMSPDERESVKEKLRQNWQDMPAGEREAKRRQLRERWQNMSPEERQRLRRDFGVGQSPGGQADR